jgi:hypothetical protein
MKQLLFILIFTNAVAVFSQDYNNWHRNYLEVGFTGGSYSNTGANMGVYGNIGYFFESFGKQAAIDIRAKEVYITSPQREAGLITFCYRIYPKKGLYFGGGFAHNHEVPFDDFLKEPVRSLFGNGNAIIHRSGFTLETGYDFKSIFKKVGLYPVSNLNITYLALDDEPNPYINLSIGLRLGMKKK